jgi:hypothetical protein
MPTRSPSTGSFGPLRRARPVPSERRAEFVSLLGNMMFNYLRERRLEKACAEAGEQQTTNAQE